MPKLSANLGFLWVELDLIDAVKAAKKAGFDAVECHWPFAYQAQQVLAVLTETGLPMVGLNTYPGNKEQDDFGVCALPDRITEARKIIEQAIDYADQIGTKNVHVMAGKAAGIESARDVYIANLNYAAELAKVKNIGILIEPINRRDVADYFLADFPSTLEIIQSCGQENLKILFDCYHMHVIHGELKPYIENHLDLIGHIQIASLPNRHEPDEGEVDYADFFQWLDCLGYQGYVGAEYKPRTTTEAGLQWMDSIQK